MKIFKNLLLLFPILCGACSSVPYNQKLRYQLIQDYSKEVQKQKNLTMIAIGGGQQGRLFCISYSTPQNVTLEQARELLVDTCEGFLNRVNTDQKFRPYMVEYPYNTTNIDIMIQFVDSNNDRAQPPFMALVANYQGNVCYSTINMKEKLINIHKETYKEACKIVKETKN